MKELELQAFQQKVWDYYVAHGRHDMPWRTPEANGGFDPYKILVSELMLQQTQVRRVIPKFVEFMAAFPNIEALASASLGDVLVVWSGLGYNRRAKFLHLAAQKLATEFDGQFPEDGTELVKLPGVGKNTAGAILAYAFNQPIAFIETNIRTVYIHVFFKDATNIPDGDILALVEKTLDRDNPRLWYWALMDFGTYLKQTAGNLNKLSKSYNKQSPFQGSLRQIRGQVIRLLSQATLSDTELSAKIDDDRLATVLDALVREGMIIRQENSYRLS